MQEFNVLIVDDDKAYLNMICTFFQSLGMDTTCVGSGKEAIKEIKDKPFNVIFTDFQMPEINGIELALKVRSMVPEVPIFLFTAYPTPAMEDAARQFGISRVISKGYPLKDILAIALEEKMKQESKVKMRSEEMGEKEDAEKAWVCPKCGARFKGWSMINTCSKCGYTEEKA